MNRTAGLHKAGGGLIAVGWWGLRFMWKHMQHRTREVQPEGGGHSAVPQWPSAIFSLTSLIRVRTKLFVRGTDLIEWICFTDLRTYNNSLQEKFRERARARSARENFFRTLLGRPGHRFFLLLDTPPHRFFGRTDKKLLTHRFV